MTVIWFVIWLITNNIGDNESPGSVPAVDLGPGRTATVTGPDGESSILLVYEQGAWRVDASAIDLYCQRTPEAAVRAWLVSAGTPMPSRRCWRAPTCIRASFHPPCWISSRRH